MLNLLQRLLLAWSRCDPAARSHLPGCEPPTGAARGLPLHSSTGQLAGGQRVGDGSGRASGNPWIQEERGFQLRSWSWAGLEAGSIHLLAGDNPSARQPFGDPGAELGHGVDGDGKESVKGRSPYCEHEGVC